MPKARDLFGPKKVVESTNLEENFSDIESLRNLRAKTELKKRMIPRIDYATASNFAKFGSAELYYQSAMENIANQYPYDGSEAEKVEFLNASSYIDLYIFENEYPRQNGYVVISSNGWGSSTGITDGFGMPVDQEYISVRGNLNTASAGMVGKPLAETFSGSNIYDENPYDTLGLTDSGRNGTRTDNLLMDFQRGVTLEFWMKKNEFLPSSTQKEVVFDVWNSAADTSDSYGRLTLYMSASADGAQPWRMNLKSGSVGFADINLGTWQTTGTLADGEWHHYAFSVKSESGQASIKCYLDGDLKNTLAAALDLSEVTGAINGRVGALIAAPSGSSATAGAGKLSASLDELRYWKTERSAEDIGKNYITNVYGGANTDISNTELGLYFKFNEGIALNDTLDAIVLDYSGRVSNGNWVGYPGPAARSTGSAIVLAGAAPVEFRDPVVYKTNPDYVAKLEELTASGSYYDTQNTSLLFNTFPNFVIDGDNGNLKSTVQIMASQFDDMYLEMQEVNRVKDVSYGQDTNVNADVDYKAHPNMDRVLQSIGIDTNELFEDQSLQEFARARNDLQIFEKDLTDVKNQVYSNIYNNAMNILKSKGTEKSVRNFLRCLGVNDRVINLNMYSNNREYVIEDRFVNNTENKKYIDFDRADHLQATIFQTASSNPNTRGQTFVSGTNNVSASFTAEVNVYFPRKRTPGEPGYYTTSFLTSSIFGTHRVDSNGSYDWFPGAGADSNFQLVALRPFEDSKDARFAIITRYGGTLLTTDLYKNVYDGNEWTFAVSLFNSQQDYAGGPDNMPEPTYYIGLTGYNTEGYFVKESFVQSASIANTTYAQNILTQDKRYFLGADRFNYSGSVQTNTDVKIGYLRHYDNTVLTPETVAVHAKDRNVYGPNDASRNISMFNSEEATGSYFPEVSSLLFNVDFQTVTGSDASGGFLAVDFASGSISATEDIRNNYPANYADSIATQYEFSGFGFEASSQAAVDNRVVVGSDIQMPESLLSTDLVNVLTSDDEVFTREYSPETLYSSLEKSLSNAYSREIIDFLGSAREFNEIIGEAGAQYRGDYGKLPNLRDLFFQRLQVVTDFNKFYEFYKWFDDSVLNFILQLVPESANVRDGIQNVIESHILERNKVMTQYPLFRQVVEDTNTFGATLQGRNDLDYNWKYGHAPVGTTAQSENTLWWKNRAEREGTSEAASDSAAVQIVSQNRNLREYRKNFTAAGSSYFKADSVNNKIAENVSLDVAASKTVAAGVNPGAAKDPALLKSVVSKFSPAENVRISINGTDTQTVDNDDIELELGKRKKDLVIFRISGTGEEEVSDYYNYKVDSFFPGTILSASATRNVMLEDYNSVAQTKIDIGNMHLDTVIGNEIPAQGVFTETHVGGNQHRHIDINAGSDDATSRPESFKIRAGESGGSPFIWISRPQATDPLLGTQRTRLPYAIYTRDELAKRPLNIKNIKYNSGSQNYGNYKEDYELMQLGGRTANNVAFVQAGGFGTASIDSTFVTGVVDYTKPSRPARKHVIVNRFSAPGDANTMGDNQGGPGLDYEAAEYSPYNNLNFRNLTVRLPLNKKFLVDRANSGGFSSDSSTPTGAVNYNPSYVISSSYYGSSSLYGVNRGVPSFHKVQRNGTPVRTQTSSVDFVDNGTDTKVRYDNAYVATSIPATDLRYQWISSSIEGTQNVLVYQSFDGLVSTSAGLVSELNFVATSDNNPNVSFVGANTFVTGAADVIFVPTIDAASLTLSYPATPTASTVNDYILDANGPYQYASFKQLRAGESRINRYFRNNNLFSYPGAARVFTDTNTNIVRTDSGPQTFVATQSVITNRYEPVLLEVEIDEAPHVLSVENGNQKVYFSQDDINKGFAVVESSNQSAFDTVISTFGSNGGIEVNKVTYRETVWPTEENSFLQKVRERIGFENNFWRDTAANRQSKGLETKPNGAVDSTAEYNRSSWDLDVFPGFETTSFATKGNVSGRPHTPSSNTPDYDGRGHPGILQNFTSYNKNRPTDTDNMPDNGGATNLSVQPMLARPHFNQEPKSVVSRHGMAIETEEGVAIQDLLGTTPGGEDNHIYSLLGSGFAKWEAGSQAGYYQGSSNNFVNSPSAPFDDTYGDYIESIRSKRKDMSIIPEYNRSDFANSDLGGVDVFSSASFDQNFSIKLANSSKVELRRTLIGIPTSSADAGFYRLYSHSDFMRHFEEVRDVSAESNLDPNRLTLKFRGVKKFVPYDGFFPAERATQLTAQFFDTYGDYSFVTGSDASGVSTTNKYRPIAQTLFAPGILFNSIKSGVAVDYPIYNGEGVRDELGETIGYFDGARLLRLGLDPDITPDDVDSSFKTNVVRSLKSNFDRRVPFEAIYNPALLDGLTIYDNEPTQLSTIGNLAAGNRLSNTVTLAGKDNLYIDMANNYLAESVNFFLESGRTTRITSQPQKNFKTVTPGKAYGMRVKMYRSLDRPKKPYNPGSGATFQIPQIIEESTSELPKAYIYINKALLAGIRDAELVKDFAEYSCVRGGKDANWDTSFSVALDFTNPTATPATWTLTGQHQSVATQDDEYDSAGNTFVFVSKAPGYNTENYSVLAENLVKGINLNTSYYTARQFEHTITYDTLGDGCDGGCDCIPQGLSGKANSYREFIVVEVTAKDYTSGISLSASNNAVPANTGNSLNQFFFVSNELIDTITEEISTQTDDSQASLDVDFKYIATDNKAYSRPTLTMYSRPTAFGPPTMGLDETELDAAVFSGSYDSVNGYNMPFTPPYYDGESWMDIIYIPPGTSASGSTAPVAPEGFKPVLVGDPSTSKQMFNFPDAAIDGTNDEDNFATRQDGLFVKYWRFDEQAGTNPGTDFAAQDGNLNSNAMQLSASINAFNVIGEGDDARWSIDLKFETPIVNFGHLTDYSSVTQPEGELSASVGRGIWHQFGRIPKEDEGIYLKVEPIPELWLSNHPNGVIGSGRDITGIGAASVGAAYTVRPFGDTTTAVSPKDSIPLTEVCGFDTKPVKLGKLREFKVVKEAVVAIPFRNVNGTKQLFSLLDGTTETKNRVDNLISSIKNGETDSSSIAQQVQKMLDYNFPPYLDFITYPEKVEPYAAYVFEFEHTFSKDDLNYIWQNLVPPSGKTIEEVESVVSHVLKSDEILGKYDGTDSDTVIPSDIQWMVFKVKQKAKTNYDRDILGADIEEEGQQIFGYNWPYDHFSLVEVGKLDVEVDLEDKE